MFITHNILSFQIILEFFNIIQNHDFPEMISFGIITLNQSRWYMCTHIAKFAEIVIQMWYLIKNDFGLKETALVA